MKKLMIMVPTLQGGGQERIAALTSKILEDDYEIIFLVFDNKESKYQISAKSEYIDLGIPSSKNFLMKIVNVIKRTLRVREIRNKKKIDICFSFGSTANIVNCLSGGRGKTVVSIRNSSKFETGERNVINNLIYNKSDAVICVSEGQIYRILKYYPNIERKMYVIYNPCDIEYIDSIRSHLSNLDNGNHSVISCGRLEGVKCYKNLFNAIKIVHESISDIRLIVLGEGSQRAELEDYIKKKSMDHYIVLAGFKDNPFEYIARGGVFALSSAREGFPNVLVEALSCAVPVISTDCEYGPREILSGFFIEKKIMNVEKTAYGILVPPFLDDDDHQGDKEKVFADGIIELIRNKELRQFLISNGLLRAKDFSKQEYKRKIVGVFEKLCSRGGGYRK